MNPELSYARKLKEEIVSLRASRRASIDPSAKQRAFVVATPKAKVEKVFKPNNAPGKDAQLIERLGFDLIATASDGSALVHATDARLEQMINSLEHLDTLGVKEKIKWAHLQKFGEIPIEYKTSLDWWRGDKQRSLLDSIIDLQPFLSRDEVDSVINAIRRSLQGDETLTRIGREFTGRVWLKVRLLPESVLALAKDFQAIFSIHPPLVAITSTTDSTENPGMNRSKEHHLNR